MDGAVLPRLTVIFSPSHVMMRCSDSKSHHQCAAELSVFLSDCRFKPLPGAGMLGSALLRLVCMLAALR